MMVMFVIVTPMSLGRNQQILSFFIEFSVIFSSGSISKLSAFKFYLISFSA
jgi:hypothetical protein